MLFLINRIKSKLILLLAMVFLVFLAGCAETTDNCMDRLNKKLYKSVATDGSCSSFERASGYVGMAGFDMTKLIAPGATSNFSKTLGIEKVTNWSTWTGKTYYENAMQLTGDASGDRYYAKKRGVSDVETHFVATLGSLITHTYIEIDQDGDGSFSTSEVQNFSKINPPTAATFGQNKIVATSNIQVKKTDGSVYLLDVSNGNCTADADLSGVWSGTTQTMADCGLVSTSDLANAALGSNISVVGECSFVVQVDDIQKIFTSEILPNNSIFQLLESALQNIGFLSTDMTAMGIGSTSDLAVILNDFTTIIDNGATCTNSSLSEIDQIITLISNASRYAIGTTENPAANYANLNKIAASSLASVSDTSVSLPSTSIKVGSGSIALSCSNSANLTARMIYKTASGSYIPYYEAASPNIRDNFASLTNIQYDSSGDLKPSIADDGIISFNELLCIQ